jgi:ferredoxin-NADP reductase/Na+-translocating ferredoxin:NAD+ oxidoreductase RnfD subunit
MDFIDSFLNRITMYRLTLWGLSLLAALSVGFTLVGWLPYTGFELLISLVLLLIAARAANAVGALFTKAAPTPESAYITALILFFIIQPIQSSQDALLIMLVAATAMISKYLFTVNKKHIFNPAALAIFIFSVAGSGIGIWWVATPIMLPFVIILGVLIVRKLRRWDLFLSFVVTATIVFLIRSFLSGVDLLSSASLFATSFPVIFFGTVMLTEPQTTPPNKTDRLIYGGIVGILFSVAFQFGTLSATPEFALLIGNIYSFFVSRYKRFKLQFKSMHLIARDTYEFVFVPETPVVFAAGQYMEWTSPHRKKDSRGVRRYFTIASAPSDPFIRLGLRVPVESSSFKDSLKNIKKNTMLYASNVAGGFTLPKDPNQKIACIAGGIGITPFMSMFRELASENARRDMVLIYAAATPLDFAYKDEIDSFKDAIGLKVLYLPTDLVELSNWEGLSGYLTNVMVKDEIPDYASRNWYLSGPDAMVKNYKWLVRGMGVPSKAIKTDYFPGF